MVDIEILVMVLAVGGIFSVKFGKDGRGIDKDWYG